MQHSTNMYKGQQIHLRPTRWPCYQSRGTTVRNTSPCAEGNTVLSIVEYTAAQRTRLSTRADTSAHRRPSQGRTQVLPACRPSPQRADAGDLQPPATATIEGAVGAISPDLFIWPFPHQYPGPAERLSGNLIWFCSFQAFQWDPASHVTSVNHPGPAALDLQQVNRVSQLEL